ncbi:MAG: hypothetical protein SGARI_003484 [Bacillariaceae sp.]
MMSLLTNGRGDAAQEELVKKTMQVAELNVQVQRLGADKEEMAQENARTRKELQDLSVVVRSLQNSVSYSSDEEEDFDEDDEDEEEVELTAEKALDMTLSNMKAHIEVLEDALQTKSGQCKEQKKKLKALHKDNENNLVKVEMLETLFRELNKSRSDEEVRKDQETQAAEAKTVEDTTKEAPVPQQRRSLPSLHLGEKMRQYRASREKESTPAAAVAPVVVLHPKQQSSVVPTMKMNKIKICFKKAGLEGTYTGPVKEGMPHGVGSIRFTNGDTYLGEMNRGRMSGKGTMFSKSKGVMRGQFVNNRFVEPPSS